MLNIKGDATIEIDTLSKKISKYISGKDITKYFTICNLEDNLGKGISKHNRLFNSFANELNKFHDDSKIIQFIETICKPIQFDSDYKFNNLIGDINQTLIFMGCKIDEQGKIISTSSAASINEALERTNKLKLELDKRKIHPCVMKYCSKEYLANDYFHACFEAVKGLFDRIRQMTGRNEDGNDLLDRAFNKNEPLFTINAYSTITDKDEFLGFKFLLLFLHKSVRNFEAHNTRLNNETELEKALDIFVCISIANKYLDNAQPTCFTNKENY